MLYARLFGLGAVIAGFVLLAPSKAQATPPEGALIQVRTDGMVGVLLDEVPPQMRDRVAEELEDESTAFWVERAQRQVALMQYRLVYRHFFYAPEEGKRQLPLPPKEARKVVLGGSPTRATVNGHDLVVVPYHFKSYLVSDEASPAQADPALATIGGETEESFVLPVDPDLLFQRTGYACADEVDFPPNSVDAENIGNFFDDSCGVETEETLLCHTLDTLVDRSCVDAIDDEIGALPITLSFKRVGYAPGIAQKFRVGTITNPVRPDLIVRQGDLETNRLIYRYIDENSCAVAEGCVGGTGWRRLLQFEAAVQNLGGSAVHIGDVDYYLSGETSLNELHNVFEFSDCHEHLHFNHYGSFLYGNDPNLGSKRAFCLLSGDRYSNNELTPLVTDYSSCEYQGIEQGWGDTYLAGIECQWLDVTDIDVSAGPVTQNLTFEVNPDGFLCEGERVLDTNGDPVWESTPFTTENGDPVDRMECHEIPGWEQNNVGNLPITLPVTGGYVTAPCHAGELGPKKNCGFAPGDVETCTPGETVNLVCSAPNAAEAQAIRVCEVSDQLGGVACAHAESLASDVIDGSSVPVSFTCPAVRDAAPEAPYGAYSLYGSAIWDEDGIQPIDCVLLP